MQHHRQQLLQLYRMAIEAVSGEGAVYRALTPLPAWQSCSLVAIGKAAGAMALGAQRALGERLRAGLVITKSGHCEPRLDRRIQQIESAHPIPDESSLAAGRALLDFLAALPEGEPLLFLLSGGASALVEVLPPALEGGQLAELNSWLLASGLAIGEMNAIRKRLSLIKGGRLIPYLKGRPCLQLLISDVPGDAPAVIGSGPLIAGSQGELPDVQFPPWLEGLLHLSPMGQGDEADNIETRIIANNAMARAAVVVEAARQGIEVVDHPGHFTGDVATLAADFCDTLLDGPPALHLWGGEGSVVLPEHPGRGGRSQQLALAAARHLAGHANVLLLAVGSDGSDGPTEDAGALVDGGTVTRGEWEGLDPLDALERADAGRFLEESGDLIQTGPTGTNVMDLVFGWRWHDAV